MLALVIQLHEQYQHDDRQPIDIVLSDIEFLDNPQITICLPDQFHHALFALAVKNKGAGFIFRAAFEDWSQEELVRQLY